MKPRTREDARREAEIKYTYMVTGSGEIVGTKPVDGPLVHDGSHGPVLSTWSRPRIPEGLNDPKKIEQWKAYWEQQLSWWDAERAQEFRDRTWR